MDVFDDLTPLAANRLRASVFGSFAQAYQDRLYGLGYARSTVRRYLYGLSHFAYWTTHQKSELANLKHLITRFVDWHLQRCKCADPVQCSRESTLTALGHLVSVVAGAGVMMLSTGAEQSDRQLQQFGSTFTKRKVWLPLCAVAR